MNASLTVAQCYLVFGLLLHVVLLCGHLMFLGQSFCLNGVNSKYPSYQHYDRLVPHTGVVWVSSKFGATFKTRTSHSV